MDTRSDLEWFEEMAKLALAQWFFALSRSDHDEAEWWMKQRLLWKARLHELGSHRDVDRCFVGGHLLVASGDD